MGWWLVIGDAIIEIGHDNFHLKFDDHNCEVINKLHAQSPDLNQAIRV